METQNTASNPSQIQEQPQTPKSEQLVEHARVCFQQISSYLSAELAASSEDLELLEKINLVAKDRIEKLSTESIDLVAAASRIQQSYNEIDLYLAQADLISKQVEDLHILAEQLDSYSQTLETKFKNYLQ